MISIAEAHQFILTQSLRDGTEYVALHDAKGCILAENILSDRPYPPFNRVMMDGYAVRSAEFNVSPHLDFEIAETIHAGHVSTKNLQTRQCYKIMTGASLPDDADAVIRREDAVQNGTRVTFSISEVQTRKNVAIMGEDTAEGEMVLNIGKYICPTDLTLLATVGKHEISVFKKLKISVISTGDEVRPVHHAILPHQIRDSNSYVLKAMLTDYPTDVTTFLVQDDLKELESIVIEALSSSDIVISTGGVSMGDADFLPSIFEKAGVQKIFHKVRMKPGKPIWFGAKDQTVVFGLPGNPMSTQVGFKLFIEPHLRSHFKMRPQIVFTLPLSMGHSSRSKFDEFFPCKYDHNKTALHLVPNQYSGSGDIGAMIASDGIGWHPAENEHMSAGDLIKFIPWNVA